MGARKESLPAKEFCASPAVFGLRVSALGFPALRTAVETTDFTDNTDKGGIAGPGAFTSALTKPFPIRVIRVIRGFCIRPSGFGLLSAFGFRPSDFQFLRARNNELENGKLDGGVPALLASPDRVDCGTQIAALDSIGPNRVAGGLRRGFWRPAPHFIFPTKTRLCKMFLHAESESRKLNPPRLRSDNGASNSVINKI